MIRCISHTAILMAVLATTACSVEAPPPDADQQTLIDDQLKVMDKANELEQQVLDSQNKTDEAMKENQ